MSINDYRDGWRSGMLAAARLLRDYAIEHTDVQGVKRTLASAAERIERNASDAHQGIEGRAARKESNG